MALEQFPSVTIRAKLREGFRFNIAYVVITLTCGSETKRILWADCDDTLIPMRISHELVAIRMWEFVHEFEEKHAIEVSLDCKDADGGGVLEFDLNDPEKPRLWVGDKSVLYGYDPDRAKSVQMLKEFLPKYKIYE